MRRSLVTLIVLATLAAWVSAQGSPPPLPAATQAKLFKSNLDLLGALVDHGVKLADADNPLKRAEECRMAAISLGNSLGEAAGKQDPDRVVELAGLMGDVVRDGLVPNLKAAREEIKTGDPREAQLLKLSDKAKDELTSLPSKIPAEGKVSESQKVKEAIAAVEALKSKLGFGKQ